MPKTTDSLFQLSKGSTSSGTPHRRVLFHVPVGHIDGLNKETLDNVMWEINKISERDSTLRSVIQSQNKTPSHSHRENLLKRLNNIFKQVTDKGYNAELVRLAGGILNIPQVSSGNSEIYLFQGKEALPEALNKFTAIYVVAPNDSIFTIYKNELAVREKSLPYESTTGLSASALNHTGKNNMPIIFSVGITNAQAAAERGIINAVRLAEHELANKNAPDSVSYSADPICENNWTIDVNRADSPYFPVAMLDAVPSDCEKLMPQKMKATEVIHDQSADSLQNFGQATVKNLDQKKDATIKPTAVQKGEATKQHQRRNSL